jgi:hypothetical protein
MMHDLEPIALPGVRTLQLAREAELEFAGEVWCRSTRAGALVWSDDGSLLVLSHAGDQQRYQVGESLGAVRRSAGSTADMHGSRVVLACTDELRVLDTVTGQWGAGPVVSQAHEMSGVFTADGKLWLLTQGQGGVMLRVYGADAFDRPLASLPIEIAPGEGASWWLDAAHPTQPEVAMGAGMGQDGALAAFAELGPGGVEIRDVERDVVFAGYSPTGDTYALVGHCDNRVELRREGSRRARDLDTVLNAIDDRRDYSVVVLDEHRVLVPTAEGRLLLVDVTGDGLVEVRLDGDTRNWDWGSLVRAGEWLLTARLGDKQMRVWDARALGRE